MSKVPSRVWRHPISTDTDWLVPVLTGLLDRMRGPPLVVELLGDARREYALAKYLEAARDIDSFIPRRWLSFYALKQNEHTGAYFIKPTEGFMCISVVEPDPSLLDVVQAHTGVVVVASEVPVPFLKPAMCCRTVNNSCSAPMASY